MLFLWLTLQQCTPPRHENNEGVNPSWSPKFYAWPTRRTNLGPPLHDLTAEGVDINTIVPLITVSILVERADDRRTFRRWEFGWGLRIMSLMQSG
jgi:hypothetical protein